jgi:serine/threonine protein kinase
MDPFDTYFVGQTLSGRFKVLDRHEVIHEAPTACRTYRAHDDNGNVVFVKVLVPDASVSLDEQRRQIDEFVYEITLVKRCGERNMRRIVRALDSDKLLIPGMVPIAAHYFVLEWAERDLRSFEAPCEVSHLAATLRFLHQMATALFELHFSHVVHQNLSPPNVVQMPDGKTKLAGFRHARSLDHPPPHGDLPFDQTNAPPEVLYAGRIDSFEERCAVDLYHLGSLGCYLLANAGATAQLERRLPHMFHWTRWQGSFADALPTLQMAHENMIRELSPRIHELVREELTRALRELTEPNPVRRGHPRNVDGAGPRYSPERYISLYIRLARTVEFHLLKRVS